MDPEDRKVIKHKKGEYDDDRAFSVGDSMDLKWPFGVNNWRGKEIDHTKMLTGKKLLSLAAHLGIDEKDLAYLPYLILKKTGDIRSEPDKTPGKTPDKTPEPKPQSVAPEMSPEEEDAMEPSAADLASIEQEEEEELEGLEEAFEISEDLLRRLLA